MKSYRKELWFETRTRTAFVNITPEVELRSRTAAFAKACAW